MICPDCKTKDTSVIDSKPSKKGIKRRRICICGYKFTTFERPIKKIFGKKILKRTEWQHVSMYLYGAARLENADDAHDRVISYVQKNKIPEGSNVMFTKDQNRSFAILVWEKNGKFKEQRFKIAPKKETIKRVLGGEKYWDLREKLRNMPKNDRLNKEKYRLELNYLYHAVNSNIKKFNQDFFITNTLKPAHKALWQNPAIWHMFEGIR